MLGFAVDSPPLDVFGQMAVDEALLQAQPAAFCLRFFRWQGVGATFGYAQRFGEVERAVPPDVEGHVTRRPTGGGIVLHLDDLTFACVFPDGGTLRPQAIYQRLHAAVLAGLRAAGLEAFLCAAGAHPAPQGPGGAAQCFVQPVALDILTGRGKIVGGAIRRHGRTVLYQGSLQMPDARKRAAEWEAAISKALAAEWNLDWERRGVDRAVLAAARTLRGKYRSVEWIARR